MPKRPCPFEESCGPQAKVQVCQEGARWWSKRREVYDRTLNLLFSGAKNVTSANLPETMDATTTTTTTPTSPTSPTSHLQQLLLTPHGTLAKPPLDSQAPQHSRGAEVSQSANLSACVGCRRVSSELWGSCRYCECKLCETCQRACHFCGGSFCPKCSLAV
ncbi:hypothetical protein O3P69_004846 [Scylla paramamosain]